MEVQFLGTANARGIPVWGSTSFISQRARQVAQYRRYPCSVLVNTQEGSILLDAGRPDLNWLIDDKQLLGVCISHFHSDHVLGLLTLKWGKGNSIPTYIPDVDEGYGDILTDPGILSIVRTYPFDNFNIGNIIITPVSLIHSVKTQGYIIDYQGKRLAYLCDTCGLPDETTRYLQAHPCDCAIIDCNQGPDREAKGVHNSLVDVLEIKENCRIPVVYLTHISESMDQWIYDFGDQMPEGVHVSWDNLSIRV